MKRAIFSLLVASAVIVSSAVTCNVLPDNDPTPVTFTYGAYFLNAGEAGQGDAELTQFNTIQMSVTPHFFSIINNGKKLGDGGKDILSFGSKVYVALAGSKCIEAINKYNGTDLGPISVQDDSGRKLTPMSLACYENALLCSFEEGYVASIDTASLKVSELRQVGGSLHKIEIASQKLYAGDHGGNKVYMLNPVTLDIMNTIDISGSPSEMTADDKNSGLFIIAEGKDGHSSLLHIDTDSDEVSTVKSVSDPFLMDIGAYALVVYVKDGINDMGHTALLLNPTTLKVEDDFIRDGSYVRNPCGLFVDYNTGSVYIANNETSGQGSIHIYTSYGQFVTSFSTNSVNPCAATFVTGQ